MIGRRAFVFNGIAGLTAMLLTFGPAPAALAGVTGSAHDFGSLGFTDRGACSACHLSHLAIDNQARWPRDLSDERTVFDQGNNPNYIQGATILCYDCHDNQNVTDVDNDPDSIFWGVSVHGGAGYPQDIAFDDYPGAQGSGKIGYYERIDGSLPTGASGGGPTDGSPTGGHFWQSVPDNGGVPVYERGDKLDCAICHDPHSAETGTNDVMLRTSTSDGMGGTINLGDGRNASTNTRARAGQNPQLNNGRNMCASCHTYSDTGATGPGIPLQPVTMWNVDVPKPPPTDPNHAYDANSTVACTTCHRHNKIVAACDDCHGFPPTSLTEDYPGGGGAHMAHLKGVGNPDTDPDLYSFGCLGGACHPANPGDHPQGFNNDPTDVRQVNVQVAFDPAWNPNGIYNPVPQTCSQLYCHSNGLVENGEYGADGGTGENGASGLGEYAETAGGAAFYGPTLGFQPSWTDTFAGSSINACGACHGKGDTFDAGVPDYDLRINGASQGTQDVSPPDYYNAGVQSVLDGNTIYNTTGANTHFIHVYKINSQDPTYGMWGGGVINDDPATGCGCHPVRDQRDPGTGFSYHLDRRVSIGDQTAVDDTGTSNSVGRGCANRCHNGAAPADWGDNLTDGTTNNDSCVFVCHGRGNPVSGNYYGGSPGGRITKLATSLGAQDSDDKYMQSGHGLAASSNYGSGAAGADLACVDCHLLDDRGGSPGTRSYHYERVATATGNPNAPLAPGQAGANPYWLITSPTDYSADPDGLCENCHDPAVETDAHNHTAQGMLDNSDHDPKYDTVVTGTWDTFNPNCIHCHDPHGESNWFMLYDSFPEKSAHDADSIFSGPVIYDGSRFGVTVVGAAPGGHGFPPAPYAANQTAVTMLDNTSGSDYAVGDGSGICEVCHTLTDFYRSDGSAPGGNHPTTLCTDCHEHLDSFAPSACEGCHNAAVRFDPDGGGSNPPAPNVMGDGVSITGVGGIVDDDGGTLGAQPYDDGTWGFNVNGHGAMNYDAQSRTVQCQDCHDIQSHHTNGVLNTLDWPGKVGTTRVANTSHLVTSFLPGGTPSARQVAFDDYCTNQCHTDAREMRHSAPAAPTHPSYDGVMQFGQATSEANPKILRSGWTLWGDDVLTATDGSAPGIDNERFTPGAGPGGGDPVSSYWFPWTISDLTTGAAAPPYYATCVSCHDPHGVPTADQSRGLNHMVRYNWKTPPVTDKNFSCNSMCHGSKP